MGKGLNGSFLPTFKIRALRFREVGRSVLVHPTVVIADCSKVALGNYCRIDPFSVLSTSGGIQIGSHVHVGSHCSLSGGEAITIDAFATLSHKVSLFTSSDDYSGETMANPTVPSSLKRAQTGPIHLGKHVIVGAGSVIMPGVTLAEGCAIGALSFVNRSLEAWGIYAGIPVRRISDRRQDVLLLERKFIAARSGRTREHH